MSSGPLLVRSVVMTATTSPESATAAAACTHLADVAHAWAIIGPVMSGAPIFAASVGPPKNASFCGTVMPSTSESRRAGSTWARFEGITGDLGGEIDAVDVRERALPPDEG